MSAFLTRIRQLDAYTKPLDDFRVKTLSGGAVTLVSAVVILTLFVSELQLFLSTNIVEELFVDSTSGDDRVDIQFDVVFHKMPCPFISIDVMDVSGDHQSDVQDAVYKQRIDAFGKDVADVPVKQEVNNNKTVTKPAELATVPAKPACGSCYGAELYQGHCCNTCQAVKDAYRQKGWAMIDVETVDQCKSDSWISALNAHKDEGCKVYGRVQVAKVAGNFHIAPGHTLKDQHSHVHDLHSIGPSKFDTSHTINHLSFGNPYPGKAYPLDGRAFATKDGGTMFQYYVKVVPTMYVYLDKAEVFTHQFSVTKHQKVIRPGIADGLPGFFVQYEFSPLMVRFEEKRQALSHFLVSLCAIIGGVFTVASLIDSFIYQSSKVIKQKVDLGKAS
uniref:Endoplasmic reticulum-Golgi intermediate compartment protein 3 n=1 Tax=Plectus sambesii TaxID=2011161 RepID=A0A914V828_9BILA